MSIIDRLNDIENQYYKHNLNFEFTNSMFFFKEYDDTLLAYLKSYFENEDLELKKIALYIVFSSSIFEKSLLYDIFETVFLFNTADITKEFFVFTENFDEKELDNFLYILSTKLKEEELSFFIKFLSQKHSKERITLMFFLLETYKLKEEDTINIYKYLLKKEDSSILTVEDFYNNSKLIKEFTDSIDGKEILKLSYNDIDKKDSLLKKRLNKTGSIAYFFNEEVNEYQIWVRLSLVQVRAFEAVVGIDFNSTIDFPKNLLLHFLFHTEYGDNPFNIDLFFGNISDASFIKHILMNKKINFIFVGDDFIPIKSFDFVFSGPVLYKLVNKAWLSYYFKDFEWLRLRDALFEIEKGDFLQIDIPISIFRRIHLDLSLFINAFTFINKSKNVENYIRSLNPIFYTEEDIENIPKKDLEKIIKDYIIELDKVIPYLILFLSNNNEAMIKYMSYLLNEDFSDENIKSEVVKRVVFIAGYLNSRNIIYYDHIKKIAKMFKIELTEQFMNKLADSFQKEEDK